jgi:F-type H+-transporting ATPase subunit delta
MMNSTSKNYSTPGPIRPAYANIARPYASAAFEYAREKNDLPAWEAFLTQAAQIILHPDISPILSNPNVSDKVWVDLFQDLLGSLLDEKLDEKKKHFLSLLAHNKRLPILSEIIALFNHYYAAFKKNTQIRIVTALPLEENMQQELVKALTERTNRTVSLKCEIDPSVLGGAVIHIDDKVIDASVRGKLTRLLEFLLR